MDILKKIVAHKIKEVAAAEKETPLEALKEMADRRKDQRALTTRLAGRAETGVHIIAEIKRASPSKGPIRPDLDPAALARAYERGGAAALSVLTDSRFFSGSPDDLKQARDAVNLPVLRKDFIVTAYQIHETAAMGADALLLITRILSPVQLKDYLQISAELGLDALVETHSADEIRVATAAGARLIGINNRDLKTFDTCTDTTLKLAAEIGKDQTVVAESGIRSRADIQTLQQAGICNFLIGESLVRAVDPRAFLQRLRGRPMAGHARPKCKGRYHG